MHLLFIIWCCILKEKLSHISDLIIIVIVCELFMLTDVLLFVVIFVF